MKIRQKYKRTMFVEEENHAQTYTHDSATTGYCSTVGSYLIV